MTFYKHALFITVLSARLLFPTEYNWNNGLPSDSFWNTNTNWTPNGIPGASDTANFGAAIGGGPFTTYAVNVTDITFSQTVSIGTLKIANTNPNAFYFFQNGGIFFNNGANDAKITIDSLTAIFNIIGSPTTLQNNLVVENNCSQGFALEGTIIESGGVRTITNQGIGELEFKGSGSNTYTGLTTNSSGSINLNKNAGLNAFAGNLLISTGTVYYSQSNQIPNTSTVTINAGNFDIKTFSDTINNLIMTGGSTNIDMGGALTLSGTTSTTLSMGNNAAITGAGTLLLTGVGGGVTYTGTTNPATIGSALNLGAANRTLTIADGSSLVDTTISGTISNGAITKTGAGNLQLSGNNSFSGGTTLNGGTISVSTNNTALGTGSLTFNSAGTILDIATGLNIGNAIALTTNGSVNVAGSSTLSGIISGASVLNKTGVGTLTLSGNSNYTGGTTLNGGTISVANNNAALGTGSLTFNSAGTILDIATGLNIGNAIALTTNGSVNVAGSSTLSGIISGASVLNKTGVGTLTLSGNSNYTGGTTLSGGTISVANNNAALGTGSLTFNSAGTILDIATGLNIGNAIALSTNGSVNVAGSSTLSGIISGASVLNKTGVGTLTLSGNSNYTGGTTLSGGTISVANNNAALGTGSFTFNSAGTILDIATGLNIGNTIALNTNGSVNVAASSTLSGIISGASVLNKTGVGTLTLSGNSNYTGGTTLSGGTISLSSSTGLGAGALAMSSGTTLALSDGLIVGNATTLTGSNTINVASGSAEMSGIISSVGSLAKTGAGTLTLSGSNSFAGGTSLTAGTISLGASTALGSDALVMSNGTTLALSDGLIVGNATTLTGSDTLTVASGSAQMSGIINGSGSLNKTGTGTLILSGNSNYTGPTSVQTGILAIDGSITSPVSVATDGTLRGHGTIYGAVTTNGLVAPGGSIGTLYIAGNYTQQSGSSFQAEISPTSSDHLIVDGNVLIESGANLLFNPTVGIYPDNIQYPIITAINGNTVTGEFDQFIYQSAIISAQVFYTTNEVILGVYFKTFASTVTKGNPHKVAVAIDKISSLGDSDLEKIISQLAKLNVPQLIDALDVLHPAQYKGMTIIQQSNITRISDALRHRFQTVLNTQQDPCLSKCISCDQYNPLNILVWGDIFGDYLYQGSTHSYSSKQLGYNGKTFGVVGGVDFNPFDVMYFGAMGGYTSSSIDWAKHHGKGEIESPYAGLYISSIGDILYANSAVIGSWNYYKANRNIIYPGMNRVAHNHHRGDQILVHFDTGLNIDLGGFILRPFEEIDYSLLKEMKYKENGAGAINLQINKSLAKLFRNQLGLDVSKAFRQENSTWIIDLKLSWIYEHRFKGSAYTSQFIGTGVNFTTNGYYPNRSLFSPEITVSGLIFQDLLHIDLYYNGEFGNKFTDQSVGFQLGFKF